MAESPQDHDAAGGGDDNGSDDGDDDDSPESYTELSDPGPAPSCYRPEILQIAALLRQRHIKTPGASSGGCRSLVARPKVMSQRNRR